jgi:hypothetical protein
MTDQGAPPSLDFGNPFANMGGQQRMGGQQQQQQQQRKASPQYLEYNTKGRPWMERLFYNTGVAALVGKISRQRGGLHPGARRVNGGSGWGCGANAGDDVERISRGKQSFFDFRTRAHT